MKGFRSEESEGECGNAWSWLQGGAGVLRSGGAARGWGNGCERVSLNESLDDTLKRVTACSPLDEKGSEKIGATMAAAGGETVGGE